MRANEFYENAAKDLKEKLPSLKRTDYDTIDRLMQRISRRYKITGKKLHDLFVSKYGESPDHWIKQYKEKLEEEGNVNEGDVVKFPTKKSLNRKRQHTVKPQPKKQANVTEPTGNVTPLRLTFRNLPNDAQQIVNQLYYKTDEQEQNDLLWELHKLGFRIEWEVPEPYEIIVVDEKNNKQYYVKNGDVIGSEEHLKEEVESEDHMQRIKHFIIWSAKQLNLQKPYPKITLSRDTEAAQKGHHTGVHSTDGEESKIWVYIGNRNLIDIFRTIFHELVHQRQQQLDMIKHGDSYPGSPIEAMADMMAGKYIKIYGKQHPEIFQ